MKKFMGCIPCVLIFCAFAFDKDEVKEVESKPVENVEISQPEVQPEKPKKIETYKIRKNDNLWIISKRVYGVGHKWEIIYQANINKIKNPNILIAGRVLAIPDKNTKVKRSKKSNVIKPPPGYEYVRTVRAKCTGYCKCSICCGRHANGRTSIGDKAWILNGVAADPRAIPYRWMVYVPGKGFREVDDTGSAMRRSWRRGIYHIDVRFASHSQAAKFNKWADIRIYRRKQVSGLAMK
jgi:3D (Asp-Asp-Asp) domain-containing protein